MKAKKFFEKVGKTVRHWSFEWEMFWLDMHYKTGLAKWDSRGHVHLRMFDLESY